MKTIKGLCNFISGLFTFIAILALCWGIPMCLSASPKPFWKGFFICLLICVICFGYIIIAEKIRRKKLSPEERATEDEEKRKNEKVLEKASYSSTLNNSWIIRQAKEDYSTKINDFVYKKMDEMIEQAENPETKTMLLKKKNQFLEEDINKIEK